MKRLLLGLMVAAAVILQVSFLPGLRPFGIVPNIVLIVIVLSALQMVTSEVLVAAAASGLVLDVVGGANFGLWTGVLMLTTLVVGLMRRAGLEMDGLVMALGLVAAGTIVIALVIWLAFAPAAASWSVAAAAGRMCVELMVNLSLTALLWVPVKRLVGGRPAVDLGGFE